MTETAEIRWFLRGALPDAADRWFRALGPEADAEGRADRYAVPTRDGLGLKLRNAGGDGSSAEAKVRTGVSATLVCGPAAGTPEHWRKETIAELPAGPAVEVTKRRRMCRHWTAAGAPYTLELGTATFDGETWWTVCLEANGPTVAARERALGEAARRWLTHPDTPTLSADAARGYPAWLRERVRDAARRG